MRTVYRMSRSVFKSLTVIAVIFVVVTVFVGCSMSIEQAEKNIKSGNPETAYSGVKGLMKLIPDKKPELINSDIKVQKAFKILLENSKDVWQCQDAVKDIVYGDKTNSFIKYALDNNCLRLDECSPVVAGIAVDVLTNRLLDQNRMGYFLTQKCRLLLR